MERKLEHAPGEWQTWTGLNDTVPGSVPGHENKQFVYKKGESKKLTRAQKLPALDTLRKQWETTGTIKGTEHYTRTDSPNKE